PRPPGDLARALGVTAGEPGGRIVECDAIALTTPGPAPSEKARVTRTATRATPTAGPAVNAVVLGPAPDRLRWWHRRRRVAVTVDGRPLRGPEGPLEATSVVVASGQYLRGGDLVPRGHPGDGRLEVLVFALRAGERRAMRRRLPRGEHLPHPRILTASGRAVETTWADGPRALEVDGLSQAPSAGLTATVLPGVVRLLV
ncbi:MAG: hypothetical protein WCI50_13345, partial [Actinomycetes bacterium]